MTCASSMSILVKQDDASAPAVIELLESHLTAMQAQTPAESVHALDLNEYRSSTLTLWTAWTEDQLMGCGALKNLGLQQGEHLGEIKSMRTRAEFARMGVANAVLRTILEFASQIGMQRVSLETGVTDHFKAAHAFYESNGFTRTAPFGDYTNDPHSVFYTIELSQ